MTGELRDNEAEIRTRPGSNTGSHSFHFWVSKTISLT